MNSSLLAVSALGAVTLLATSVAPVSAHPGHAYETARRVRPYEPPDPCIKFHDRRAHAHCVAGLTSGRRGHDRLDPYKN